MKLIRWTNSGQFFVILETVITPVYLPGIAFSVGSVFNSEVDFFFLAFDVLSWENKTLWTCSVHQSLLSAEFVLLPVSGLTNYMFRHIMTREGIHTKFDVKVMPWEATSYSYLLMFHNLQNLRDGCSKSWGVSLESTVNLKWNGWSAIISIR